MKIKIDLEKDWNWIYDCIYNALEDYFGEDSHKEEGDFENCIDDIKQNIIDNYEEQ